MLDIHSHILPNIDDGSRSIEESIQLLTMLKQQGVRVVAATPHFYANHDSPERFLQKRNHAFHSLQCNELKELPEIRLGAEVLYFDGMSRIDQLSDLKIEGSELLLIEMPFCTWNRRWINEILTINEKEDTTVVLAHIERYRSEQSDRVWLELLENGVKMQSNAEYFLNWRTKHKALKLLNNGWIHFLGSDCHNTDKRPPRLDEAWAYIRKKLGHDGVAVLQAQTKSYFPKEGSLR